MTRAHIHDGFFRRVFSRPELAADLLRRELPRPVLDALDLKRLEPLTTEFRDPTLRSRRADVAFRVPLKGRPGRVAYVVVLIEHQSRPHRLMPLRILGYVVEIWTEHVERHRAEHDRDPDRLPAVIPVVLHQGKRPWTGPTSLLELLDLPAPLADLLRPHLPDLTLLLDDLGADADITREVELALTMASLLTMRFVRRPQDHPDFARHWASLVNLTAGEPHQRAVLEAMAEYLYSSDAAIEPAEIDSIGRELIDPDAQEVVMSLADRIREEAHEKGRRLGREEGHERGRQQGREEGREESARALRETLLKLLTLKFGPPDAKTRDRIDRATADDLNRWTARILEAPSLDALFT